MHLSARFSTMRLLTEKVNPNSYQKNCTAVWNWNCWKPPGKKRRTKGCGKNIKTSHYFMRKKYKKKETAENGKHGIYLILLGLFILEFFFFAWCRVQCAKTGYAISEETARHQKLLSLQRNFKIELARLKSPERLSRIARNRLGLISPESGCTIIIPWKPTIEDILNYARF